MEQWAANSMQKGRPVTRAFDKDRVELVKAILDAGYVDQLLISQDIGMQSQLVRNGGWGYAHISRNIEARFIQMGVSAQEIRTIRVANPRRILSPLPS
jgi:phosphotriesterase-related protein